MKVFIYTFILFSISHLCAASTAKKIELVLAAGIPALEDALQKRTLAWPRLTTRSGENQLAELMFDQMVNYNRLDKKDKGRPLVFANLAAFFVNADGWTNRVLADTAVRLSLDCVLRQYPEYCTDLNFWKVYRSSLPPRILSGSDKIADLLKVENVAAKIQDNVKTNLLLLEIKLESVYALWEEEAKEQFTAKELLTKERKVAFVARLAQTDFIVASILPLLEAYIQRGGKIDLLDYNNAAYYFRVMKTEPQFRSEWLNGGSAKGEQLMSLFEPYKKNGFPNFIMRYLKKVMNIKNVALIGSALFYFGCSRTFVKDMRASAISDTELRNQLNMAFRFSLPDAAIILEACSVSYRDTQIWCLLSVDTKTTSRLRDLTGSFSDLGFVKHGNISWNSVTYGRKVPDCVNKYLSFVNMDIIVGDFFSYSDTDIYSSGIGVFYFPERSWVLLCRLQT